MVSSFYVYVLECSDGTLYTGYTNNLKHRLYVHNSGKGAKYTKIRRPVELVYQETYTTKSEALKREYEIKTYTRQQKLKMIQEG